MNHTTINDKALLSCLSILILINSMPVCSAPGTLANSPLFTSSNVPPNIFFELDDSGSMDWEILTSSHWRNCSYDKNSYRATGDSDCGSLRTDGQIRLMPNSGDAEDFEYLYDNTDDAYSNNCSSSRETLDLCNTDVQNSDWRIRSSALNVLYYNPATTYTPWQKGDGTSLPNASFTAARSNPISSETGYTNTKDLTGFVYEVWHDSHSFNTVDGRPRRGININRTTGANKLVDLWDEHTRYKVNASTIIVETITYSPDSSGNLNATVSSTTTLTGTDTLDGRSIAEVQKNIANWYQYARRRAFAAKSAVAKVISANAGYRFGLSVINNSSTLFTSAPSGISGFSSHNTTLLSNLFSYDWPAEGTPLRRGLETVGKYFDAELTGKADPIAYQCQQNFTVLFTDGFWNGSDPAAAVGNADGDGYSLTLADVAKYYYDKDLSPLTNKVPTNVFDAATHQHMVTFPVAFGLSGLLTDTDGDGWPGNSPGLAESDNWGNAFNSDPEKIDDLWHAAYNSKGSYVAASSPEAVSQSLSDALAKIGDRIGSASSVAFNTTTLTGNSAVYLAQFNSSSNKWSGDLLSFALDRHTGIVSASATWSAANALASQASRTILTYNGSGGVPFQWGNLITSQKADLKINPDGSSSADATAQARLNFIRGDRSNELGNGGTHSFRTRNNLLGDIINSAPVFVGKPELSWPNVSPFPDVSGYTYSDFKAGSARSRAEIIYAGANDGMLHGFKATDGSEALAFIPNSIFSTDASRGLHYLTDTKYTHRYYVDMPATVSDVFLDTNGDSTLNINDWHTILIGGGRSGSRGLFALDITNPSQFTEANSANLVLWEFDQTDDSDMGFTFSQPTITMMNNGRWAAIFGNGYNSTGDGKAKLFILFLDGGLDGTWTKSSPVDYVEISTEVGTIVSSDCANASSNCNGLSTPQIVDLNGDQVADRVYAGDLKGNMWAFNISATNASQWDVAYKTGSTPKPLFTATHHSTSGSTVSQISTIPQPITSKPILVKHPKGTGSAPDVLVFFGTGQYLVDTDVTNTSVQSFYGVWDHGTKSLTPANLVEQTFLSGTFLNGTTDVTGDIRVLTNNEVDYSGSKQGWFINLTLDVGERVIVDPDVRGDLIFFNTWIPDNTPCNSGGSGFLMSVKQINGGTPDKAAFDLNGNGTVDISDLVTITVTTGGDTVTSTATPGGQRFNKGLPASSSFLSKKQYTPGTEGGSNISERAVEDLGGSETGRFSWQELH